MATMGAVNANGPLVRTAARTGVSYVPRRTLTSTAIRRAQENNGDDSGKSRESTPLNPSFLSSMKNYFFGEKKSKAKVTHVPTAPKREEGGLGADSIFAEDLSKPSGPLPSRRRKQMQQETEVKPALSLEERNKGNLQSVLNPDPKSRGRWERRMVAREIRTRGRLPREVQIKRTERESLSKSHFFKTSVKKLGPLARQISGKNIDEAILQMRFSKKQVAKDVLEHLKHAKNVAMVRAGMGFSDSGPTKPLTVILKSGERQKIEDPSSIYIQQAWVNRGPYGMDYDHRARGQINLLRPPSAGLSVLLKEEKTRIREYKDREARALRQREAQLWTQLPDRKISAQNQYYSW